MASPNNPKKPTGGNDEWQLWANYVLLTLEKLEKENDELKDKCHSLPDCHGMTERMIIVEQEQLRHRGFTARIAELEHTAKTNAKDIATMLPLVSTHETFKTKVETRTGLIAALVSACITIALFIIDKAM